MIDFSNVLRAGGADGAPPPRAGGEHGGGNRRQDPRVALGLALVVAVAACAVSEAPSGGPEDKVPPVVKFSIPRADSTGIDPSSPIQIGFSEAMREERVERLVSTNPPIVMSHVHWKDNTLVIEPEGGLVRDTTYVVRIRPAYQDRHGVAGAQWHEFAFATGAAALDTARIEGTVRFKREPAAHAVVRCFRADRADTLDPEKARPDREAATDKDGKYSLRYLPSKGTRFVVAAFIDQNGNGTFDHGTEPFALCADTTTIASAVPVVTGVDIVVIDPNEPGVVRGSVSNESGVDSVRVMVGLYTGADSTRAAARAVCDSAGVYELREVRPGEYILHAFVDIRADSAMGTFPCPADTTKGCPEPAARRPGSVVVKPAATVDVPRLTIRRREER